MTADIASTRLDAVGRPPIWSNWPELVVVCVITAVVVVPIWPGVFTIDSQAMLRDASEGQISDWYSPVLQAFWGLLDTLGFSPGTMFVVGVAGLTASLLVCFRLGLNRVWAMAATVLTMLFPPVYGLAGWVGRDVWFAAFVIGVLAALGWATRRPARLGFPFALAFVGAWFAADARQNGLLIYLVVGAVIGWTWAASRGHVAARTVGVALLCLVLGVGTMVLARSFIVTRDQRPEDVLYFQDLVAMSLRRNELLVPAQFVKVDDLDEIRAALTQGQVGAVFNLVAEMPSVRDPNVLRSAWLESIREHPLDYIAVRGTLWLQLMGLRSGLLSAWFGGSDLLNWDRSPELAQAFPTLTSARYSVLDTFDDGNRGPGPLHRPVIFLVAGLFGSVLLIVAGSAARLFGIATLGLQVVFQATLAATAPVVEFRFEYFQVLLGIVLGVLGLSAWWVRRSGGDPWPVVSRPLGFEERSSPRGDMSAQRGNIENHRW